MITCVNLSYTYPSGQQALHGLSLTIPDGAFVLVTGVSGAGKSTLLRAFNGLVPHFYGGQFGGSVQIDGQDTLLTAPRLIARSVGFVFQDPEMQFVVQTVEDEIAFGLENQGVPPTEMIRRIDEVLELLHIAHLRQRHMVTLSGGEAQRVAIASALALQPLHLVLDEPTSQLDPPAAHSLLDTLVDLNRRHRLTIILAEHRLERVLRHASHLLHLTGEAAHFGPVREILPHTSLRPPIAEAALRLGWEPIPLSVEAARPFAAKIVLPEAAHFDWTAPSTDLAVEARGLAAGYTRQPVIEGLHWAIRRGEIVGLLGVNGAGKSTLLKTLVGLLKPTAGEVRLMGQPIAGQKIHALARIVGYVPQNPNSVLFAETLREEIRFTRQNHGLPGDGLDFLARLGLADVAERYPRDLSGGERQRAALAAMLAAEPPIVLLDEPTRGLDYVQKRQLGDLLRGWSAAGTTVIVATHDVEWIAGVATRVTVLERGRLAADGPADQVLLRTPSFNTQLGELFHHPDFLTPDRLPVPQKSI
jgi:energy-coupling factor transport system ATP-binding protein